MVFIQNMNNLQLYTLSWGKNGPVFLLYLYSQYFWQQIVGGRFPHIKEFSSTSWVSCILIYFWNIYLEFASDFTSSATWDCALQMLTTSPRLSPVLPTKLLYFWPTSYKSGFPPPTPWVQLFVRMACKTQGKTNYAYEFIVKDIQKAINKQ